MSSLAPHERLPEILVVPREKTPTGAAARGNPGDEFLNFLGKLWSRHTSLFSRRQSTLLSGPLTWGERMEGRDRDRTVFEHLQRMYGLAVDWRRGRGSGCSRPGYGISPLGGGCH